MRKISWIYLGTAMYMVFGIYSYAYAIDSDLTRRTLKGIRGVHVIVEDLQPNLKGYGQKNSLSSIQMEKDVENTLQSEGIEVFTRDRWLKTAGRPLLYININTHDDKFRVAYDVKIELRQIVSMEANPDIKTLAPTWSINMTGIVGIDKLDIIRDALVTLMDRFIKAYWTANSKESKK
jgi:hypothetical protein